MVLIASGCGQTIEVDGIEPTQQVMVQPSQTVTIEPTIISEQSVVLCIGDSITEGLPNENYPDLVRELIQDENVKVFNHGVSGTTVTKASLTPYNDTDAYQQSLEHDHVDAIMLLFGTNDTNTTTWVDEETFYQDYSDLITIYQTTYPNAKFAIGSIIDVFDMTNDNDGIAMFDIQPEYVDDVNSVINQLADDYGLTKIDLYGLTNDHLDWYDGDGIHPNIVGKRYISQAVYDWLKPIIME